MTLGKKLAICFGAVCALNLVMGGGAWYCVTRLQSELEQSVNSTAKKVEIVSDIRSSVLMFRLAERGILLFTAAKIPEKVQLNKDLFAKTVLEIGNKIGMLRPLLVSEEGHRLTDSMAGGVSEYARIQADIPRLCNAGKLQGGHAGRCGPPGTFGHRDRGRHRQALGARAGSECAGRGACPAK